MADNEPVAPRRAGLTFRSVLLVVFVALITLFCAFNRTYTYVWPFGQAQLFVVILIAFALGLGVGWLLRSITSGARRLHE